MDRRRENQRVHLRFPGSHCHPFHVCPGRTDDGGFHHRIGADLYRSDHLPAKEENRIDFTESSQKISTLLLTLLIIDVILHIEQMKGDRKGIFERGFQKKLLKRASKKFPDIFYLRSAK